MTRDEQAWNIDAANTTTHAICIDDRLTKELLAPTDFDCRLRFSRSAENN